MATITELADFGSTAFFDNRTWLNQENWQAYFGGSLPSGVVVDGKLGTNGQYYTDALTMRTVNSSYKAFNPGTVIINGIFAKYSANTYIPVIKTSEVDRLIVARVYLLAGMVKIVGKTKIAQDNGYTTTVFAGMLLKDESLGCIRTDTYYEIPLCYEVYGANSYDLRRLYYLPSKANPFLTVAYNGTSATAINPDMGVLYGQGYVNVYGGTNYDIQINSADTTNSLYIYPVPTCSEKPTVIYIKNNSNVDKQIRLPILHKGLTFSYEWIDNWDVEEGSGSYKYRDLVAQDKIALILTPFKSGDSFGYTVSSKGLSEGIDPEDYYTKQEMTVLLAQKVAKDYVDGELALKANTSDLGDLAYQNTANYLTQLTNKPTLGALADNDTIDLTSEVTNILPIENGGTGADTLAGFIDNVIGVDKTWYVNVANGDDSNDGTTSAKAFKTISHAIGVCPYLSKCTIVIAGGSYTESITIPFGKFVIFRSAARGSTITLASPDADHNAITIDGGTLYISGSNTYYASYVITGNYNQGLVTVKNGGQLISDNSYDNVTITNTHSISSSNNSSAIMVDMNGFVRLIHAQLTALGSLATGGKALYVSNNSRAYISNLDSIAGDYGIFCINSFVSVGTVAANTYTTALHCFGGIITYRLLSGSTSISTSAGGRIYTGAQE